MYCGKSTSGTKEWPEDVEAARSNLFGKCIRESIAFWDGMVKYLYDYSCSIIICHWLVWVGRSVARLEKPWHGIIGNLGEAPKNNCGGICLVIERTPKCLKRWCPFCARWNGEISALLLFRDMQRKMATAPKTAEHISVDYLERRNLLLRSEQTMVLRLGTDPICRGENSQPRFRGEIRWLLYRLI